MMIYDLIMIVVLIAATVWGVYKGLAWQVASLSSIFLSYVVCFQFRGVVASQIKADPPWNIALAMLLLYLGTSLVIWVAFRFVKNTIDRIRLHEFDRQVGGLLGLAKGVLLCVIITLFGMALFGDSERQQIVHSHSGYYIAVLLDKSHAVLPREIYDTVHPVLHTLDESLPEGYESSHDHDHHAPAPAAPTLPGGNDLFRYGVEQGLQNGFGVDPRTAGQPNQPPPYPVR